LNDLLLFHNETYFVLQSNEFIKFQKAFITVQMEKNLLANRLENYKLIKDKSIDNDVNIYTALLLVEN